MKKIDQKPISAFFLILISLLVSGQLAYADAVIEVAVLPFRINSEEDLDYLKRGVLDMLSSRISVEGKVVVLENTRVNEVLSRMREEPITEEVVKEIGNQLAVDFIISGSLTKIGQSVSVDAKMFDLKKKDSVAVTSLFATSEGMDNVIPKINDFALKANARITGEEYPEHSIPLPSASSRASDFMSEFLSPGKREKGEGKKIE